jgi:hypothetical protein
VQGELLKEKEIKILSLKKSLAKKELIVDELTRESFLLRMLVLDLRVKSLNFRRALKA